MDDRLTAACVYCGAPADTRDHSPAKVFLDDPLPPDFDLPVLPSCSLCNAGSSMDEEYLSCLLECVICGSAAPGSLRRDKVRRCLERNGRLGERISNEIHRNADGKVVWQPEMDRVLKVVLKLARGHVAYDLYPQLHEPSEIFIQPLVCMSVASRRAFESLPPGESSAFPEIGTRAFRQVLVCGTTVYSNSDWLDVQPGRYRYTVNETDGVVARIVLSEYLACRVKWM